ncbi:MAG TPA: hypothetical protein VF624_09405 [Tepidisphaeraceae bacterium]
MNNRAKFVVVALCIAAIVARLVAAYAIDAPARTGGEETLIARHLLDGNGFSFTAFGYTGPTSVRGPLLPMLLAAIESIFSQRAVIPVAIAINAIAGAVATALAYIIARRLALGTLATTAFAAAVALWPTQVFAAIYLQPMSVAITLSLGAICLLLPDDPRRAQDSHAGLHYTLIAGACTGVALLGEPILLFPIALAALLLLGRRPVSLCVFAAGVLLLVGPWLYRNALVHGRPTPITNTFAAALFRGNSDRATGSIHRDIRGGRPHRMADDLTPQQFDALRGRPEADRNSRLWQWATAWIGDHPAAYVKLCGARLVKTFWLDVDHPYARSPLAWLPRTLAAAATIVALLPSRRRRLALAACAIAVAIALAAAPALAEARNSVFVDLPQLLAAACLLDRRSLSADTK